MSVTLFKWFKNTQEKARETVAIPVPESLQYKLVGTPSGHLWQANHEGGRPGDIREMECYYCHVKIKERYIQGITTNWWKLITWNVPKCTNTYKTRPE